MAFNISQYIAPGVNSTYIPGYGEKQQADIFVHFALNEDDYAFNKLYTMTTVGQMIGNYPRSYTPDRLRIDTTLNQYRRKSGQLVNPYIGVGNIPNSRRTFVKYEAIEYYFEGAVDDLTQQQSPLNEVGIKQTEYLQKAMIVRGYNFWNTVTTAANWAPFDTTHVQTATALSGGFWDLSSSTLNYIKKGLGKVQYTINLDMGGYKQMVKTWYMVTNPITAAALGLSPEIYGYLINQPGARTESLAGMDPSVNQFYLPNPLFGYPVIIDESVYQTAVETSNGTTEETNSYIMPNNVIYIGCRPGSIASGMEGSPFSTVHMFGLKGHQLQPITIQPEAALGTYIAVRDIYSYSIVTPESGFLITGVCSTLLKGC